MTSRFYQRGGTMPETAIVLSVALALIFAIVDFGRALYTYSFVTDAARQGARWAAVRGSQSCSYSGNTLPECNATAAQVAAYVQSLAQAPTKAGNVTVNTTYPTCTSLSGPNNNPGCVVSVRVQYNFSFVLAFMPSTSIPLASTSEMVIAQ